ncbi:hypothetical protein WJX72_005586 [[Myrmecia] bisecta]|uniref:Ion transport domain-containing protein n=1 Tax=[Myrmecia] bisecta TaxID=41462 RepID=A0AAW1QQP4_9CHLO
MDPSALDFRERKAEGRLQRGPQRTSISEFERRNSITLQHQQSVPSARTSNNGSTAGQYAGSVLTNMGSFNRIRDFSDDDGEEMSATAPRGRSSLSRAPSSFTPAAAAAVGPAKSVTKNFMEHAGFADAAPVANQKSITQSFLESITPTSFRAPAQQGATAAVPHSRRPSNLAVSSDLRTTLGADKTAQIKSPRLHYSPREHSTPRSQEHHSSREEPPSPSPHHGGGIAKQASAGSELFNALRTNIEKSDAMPLDDLFEEDEDDFNNRQRAMAQQRKDADMLERLQRRMAGDDGTGGAAAAKPKLKGALKHTSAVDKPGAGIKFNTPDDDAESKMDVAVEALTEGASSAAASDAAPADLVYEPDLEAELAAMNVFRRNVVRLATNPNFEAIAITLIFANIVSLAMYNPMQPHDSKWNHTLETVEVGMNGFFTLELIMRGITAGSLKAYLKVPWNTFDIFMVLAGWTSLIPAALIGNNTQAVRAMRAMRALRPLRTITRFESLRSIVVCFLEALPMLMSVVGLLLFAMFMFAIAGMMMFDGAYHRACANDATGELERPPSNNIDEYGCGYRKCPPGYTCTTFREGTQLDTAGYDNVASSFLSVFQVITMAAWSYQMYRIMDATFPAACIYFILVIFFGTYFVINLFLAVLKDKFGKAQKLFRSAVKMSRRKRKNLLSKLIAAGKGKAKGFAARKRAKSQADWAKRQSTLESGLTRGTTDLSLSRGETFGTQSTNLSGFESEDGDGSKAGSEMPDPADLDMGPWEARLFAARWHTRQLAESPNFMNFFLCCTVINTVLLAMDYDGMSPAYALVLKYANLVLTCMFTSELGIKLFALGFLEYIADNFNTFDMVVVTVSWVDLLLDLFAGGQSRQLSGLRVLRAFRVLRLFKLFKYLPSLRRISEVLLATVSSFAAIAALALLFMIVYAIIGLHVYGGVVPIGPRLGEPYPNFDTFFNAFVLIFQALTMENWEQNMYGYMDATNTGAALFFVSWIVVGSYTFLQLFLAVTLEAFESKYDTKATTEAYLAYKGKKSKFTKLKFLARRSFDFIRGSKSQVEEEGMEGSPMIRALRSDGSIVPGNAIGDKPAPDGAVLPSGTETPAYKAVQLPRLGQPVAEGTEVDDSEFEGTSGEWAPQALPMAGRRTAWQDEVQHFRIASSRGLRSPVAGPVTFQHVLDIGRADSVESTNSQQALLAPNSPRAQRAASPEGYRSRAPPDPGPSAAARSRMAVETSALSEESLLRHHSSLGPKLNAQRSMKAAAALRIASPLTASLKREALPDDGLSPMERFMQFDLAEAGPPPGDVSWASDPNGLPSPGRSASTTVSPNATLTRPDARAADRLAVLASTPERKMSLAEFHLALQGKSLEDMIPKVLEDVERSRHSVELPPAAYRLDVTKKVLNDAEKAEELFQPDRTSIASAPPKYPRLPEALDDDDRMSSNSSHSKSSRSTASGVLSTRKEIVPLEGTSLFFLKADNLFRMWLYDLVGRRKFDYVMFIFIIVSCVTMILERPSLDPHSTLGRIIHWADVVLTCIFACEAFLKILAYRFWGYIKSHSNKVDFMIVVTSAVLLSLESLPGASNLQFFQGLRVLRALKPLRTLTRSKGMMLVFKSLTLSMASMANVGIVCALFFLIFAILGVQLFGGLFYFCNDPHVAGKAECVGTFMDPYSGELTTRVWSRPQLHFDNVFAALLSLVMCASLNSYTPIMIDAMSTPAAKDLQPQPLANRFAFFYFMVFVVTCAFCLLNLFVGVVFYQFSRIRLMSETGSAFLTTKQQEWSVLAKMVFRLRPLERPNVPISKTRQRFYNIAVSKGFEKAIMAVIIANVILMAAFWYGEPPRWTKVKEDINMAFTVVFCIEAGVKIYGLTWHHYITNGWNKFDLFLVVTSSVDIILSYLAANISGVDKVLRVQKLLRLMRLTRMIKLIKSFKGLRALMATLIMSLPAFWNVGALLGLFFFMYAYVGVLLFGKLKLQAGINEHTNFRTFGSAALSLFRMSTTDDWTLVIKDCTQQPPLCDKAAGECGTPVAYVYFLSFFFLVSIIMLNLFTAVIIENYDKQQEQAEWSLTPNSLQEFQELWCQYDDGTGTIDPSELEQLILRLSPPLGLGPHADGKDVLRFVYDLEIPLVNGRVPFHRTVYELVRRCSETAIPEGEMKNQIERMIQKFFAHLHLDEELNFSVAVVVMRVQRKWRAKMRANRIRRMRAARQDRQLLPPLAHVLDKKEELLKELHALKRQGHSVWKVHVPGLVDSSPWHRLGGVSNLQGKWKTLRSRIGKQLNQVMPLPTTGGSTIALMMSGPGKKIRRHSTLWSDASGTVPTMDDGIFDEVMREQQEREQRRGRSLSLDGAQAHPTRHTLLAGVKRSEGSLVLPGTPYEGASQNSPGPIRRSFDTMRRSLEERSTRHKQAQMVEMQGLQEQRYRGPQRRPSVPSYVLQMERRDSTGSNTSAGERMPLLVETPLMKTSSGNS